MSDPRAIQLIMTLRRQGIHDQRVLSAVERTPREAFVEEPFAHQAWDNSALPIACGQTISQPYVVAYITQELKVAPNMRVLELGTGSGYQAAVLAPLCRKIYTIERHRPLLKQAEARFKQLKLDNVVTKHADGLNGWPEQAPFDRIVLSAAVAEVPLILIEQLKPGGALIAPVGTVPKSNDFGLPESFSQRLTRIIRTEAGYEQEELLPVVFVPMVSGVPQEVKTPNDRVDKRPDAFRALVLTLLAAMSLSACTESPRTQLSWGVEDNNSNTYYGPRSVKLPPVEQRRLAPPQQQKQQLAKNTTTTYAPKPKSRTTPGWYNASNLEPVQPAPRPAAYTPPQQVADSSVKFQWPVNGHVILSYGASDNGERNDGINIAAAQGAPVRAAASGTVSYCGNELKGYGNLVLIKHDNGYITAYAHVDSFVVNRSDRVLAGQVIAYAGATGDVTTPQLHFEIRGSNQRPVDPAALLPKSMRVASN